MHAEITDNVVPLRLSIPPPGDLTTVVPGILWIRMPLPFALNHVNLWLIADDDGWLAVDGGLGDERTRAAWEQVLAADEVGGRPISRVLATHCHPDHIGAVAWLAGRFDAPVLATPLEFHCAGMLSGLSDAAFAAGMIRLAALSGMPPALDKMWTSRGNSYASGVGESPASFRRLCNGDELVIGGHRWLVITVSGHAPDMVCLFDAERHILIAADQVLPSITPNVSVFPIEPLGNPLASFLRALDQLSFLPEDTLVLPSHGEPFLGLRPRLRQLSCHHDERLALVRQVCAIPRTGAQVMDILFNRLLDSHQLGFALGETLAHLNYLVCLGAMERSFGDAGEWLFHCPQVSLRGMKSEKETLAPS